MFSESEFAEYARIPADSIDVGYLSSLSREARVLIRGAAPRLPEDTAEWPEAARVVALRVVARGYLREEIPSGATSVSHSAGTFSRSFGFGDSAGQPGLWLTKQDRRDLGGKPGGAFTVTLVSPSRPRPPELWEETSGG